LTLNRPDFLSAKRVLVYRLGSLGDTAVALPSLHLIARTFPNAERILLTNFPINSKAPASAVVIGESGLIHGYMRYSAKTRNPIELGRLWWRLRRYRPDFLVYLMGVRPPAAVKRDALFFRFAGIKDLIGLPSAAEAMHILDQSTGMFEREANRLARTISALGDAHLENLDNWSLRLTRAERERASEVLRSLDRGRLVICAPGTKMQAKDWGTENWTALMQRLSQTLPGYELVLVGVREEHAICEAVATGWSGRSLNLCGQLSPRETAAVMEGAAVFMGPDSGPMHLAASVRIPCAIAFSARGKPGVWFPAGNENQVVYHKVDCFGCNLETCTVEAKKCLTSISVDEMYEAVMRASKLALQVSQLKG
jgi:heptosyltransferase III